MGLQGQLGGSSLGGALGGRALLAFDTGLYRPQRTLVRAHVVARLAPMLKTNGGYVHTLGSIPRPLKSHDDDEIGKWIGIAVNSNVPAILVALGRKEYKATGMDPTEEVGFLELAVYAVSAHARAFVDGRLATDTIATADRTADPGIEAMLEHIEQRLLGQELPLATALVIRGRYEDEVATFENATCWEQRYEIEVMRDVDEWRDVGGIVTEIDIKHNLDGADPANPVVETLTELEAP